MDDFFDLLKDILRAPPLTYGDALAHSIWSQGDRVVDEHVFTRVSRDIDSLTLERTLIYQRNDGEVYEVIVRAKR